MVELLNFFKENGVAIQITLDIGRKPIVHAIPQQRNTIKQGVQMTMADSIEGALKSMKYKLFGDTNGE
jgi:hypothetical protein